jgi:hypothetical protein
MTLEIVFIGLCAIATSDSLDCSVDRRPRLYETDPFDVVLVDPGGADEHDPALWIRRDFVDLSQIATCYAKDEYRKEQPQPHTGDCNTNRNKLWVRWDLRNTKLVIPQANDAKGKLRQGERKHGNHCWVGKKPGNSTACKRRKKKCQRDVSWLPQYTRVSGVSQIDPDILANPQNFNFVSAIVPGLAGELAAKKKPGNPAWGPTWKWEWNDPSCSDTLPDYEQSFAPEGVIENVQMNGTRIALVDLDDPNQQTSIPLVAPNNRPVKMEIRNLPRPGHGDPDCTGNKAYIPHWDEYAVLLQHAQPCRPIPYYECEAPGGPAKSENVQDPICPPGIFGKP